MHEKIQNSKFKILLFPPSSSLESKNINEHTFHGHRFFALSPRENFKRQKKEAPLWTQAQSITSCCSARIIFAARHKYQKRYVGKTEGEGRVGGRGEGRAKIARDERKFSRKNENPVDEWNVEYKRRYYFYLKNINPNLRKK